QQRVGSCAGDDHDILTESERIELIDPQEIGILGAAGFFSGARELRAGQVPGIEFPCLGIQLSQMTATGGEPDCSVGAEINSVRKTERRRQSVVLELLGLRIEHEQSVLWSVHLGYGNPNGAINRADRGGIAAG